MSMDAAGKTAVITGAASGIGRGLARAAGAARMRLVLADVAAEPLEALSAKLQADGVEVLTVLTDVSDPDALERLASYTLERFGAPRLVFANAGIESLGLAWELTATQWRRAIDINVLGVIETARVFLPAMIVAGSEAGVVITGSIGSLSMTAGSAPYMVSKHAVLSFAECLAVECEAVAPFIRISIALPGPVASSIFAEADTAESSSVATIQRAVMRQFIGSGLAPDVAGQMILEQALAGEFWIATHPEMLDASLERRAAYLQGRGRPTMPDGAKLFLDDSD
jgi:NAD(P)-dependent dehydrogenase (short-subunit alcohol dehydrogenase family)